MEVKARVKALLRRSAATRRQAGSDQRLTLGGLTLDSAARTTWKDGNPVELTAREFDLLELLMKNPQPGLQPGTVAEPGMGLRVYREYRTVDVHIRRLREKVEQDPAHPAHLCTKWGVGYYFKEA